jgi:hypothetical protein
MSAVDDFVRRWQAATGSERANCQLFVTELCALLDIGQPDPAKAETRDNAYAGYRRSWRRSCPLDERGASATTSSHPAESF